MRAAFVIAGKDLRERIRDRSALILAIVAPLGLATIFSLLLPSGDVAFRTELAVVDLDESSTSAAFLSGPLAAIEEAGIAGVVVLDDEAAAREAIEADEVEAAAIIPAGFADAVQAGEPAEVTVIGDTSAGLASEILRSLAEGYVAELEAIRLSVATVSSQLPAPPSEAEIQALVAGAIDTPSPIALVDVTSELRRMAASTFFPASMAIFFLFFTAQFGILSLLAERRQGTLPRLVAAPIPPWAIVAGKAIGSFILGVVSMTVIVVASTLLLGAEWGNPIGVALLIVAAVLSAMGITALITTLARTEEQAGGWNAIVAVTLGILGGAFFDLSQAPEALSRLSFLTPHAWFLQGLDELAAPSATLGDLALPIAVLLTIAVITGGIGLARARTLVAAR
ncbi:MAG TPA: ABC transporter permease [Candidatus Limnocylindria bacterium]